VRLSDVLGHPVVTTDAAEEIGRIATAIIDPAEHRVVGFRIGDELVLPIDDLTGIGADAVTAPGRDAVRLPSTDVEVRWLEDSLDIADRPVLSDQGQELPLVRDLEFEASTGEIEAIVFPDRRIDGTQLVGIGRFAVVVREPD